MARRGDTRSPSPAGNYSSSSRRRRDDDRISRDARVDRVQPRRRSRSPGSNVDSRIHSIRLGTHYAQRKYRDRDMHRDAYPRGHRSPERRANGETYHSSRRDRSPDQLGGKDGRHRSRDRNNRELREDLDYKSKRRGEEPGDSRHKRRREEGKDAQHSKSASGSTREVSRPALCVRETTQISNSSHPSLVPLPNRQRRRRIERRQIASPSLSFGSKGKQRSVSESKKRWKRLEVQEHY